WQNGDLAFVAWAVSGIHAPDFMLNSLDLWESETESVEAKPEIPKNYTAQDIGRKVATLLNGYSAKLGNTDNVVVMGLNSATTGRMAIVFYRQLTVSDFLARLQEWHTQCSWLQRFSKDTKFIGAPAPKDIAKASYGNDVDTKLCNATVERLIPCIIDGTPIPRDLVLSTTRRACKRHSLDAWEWEKTLGIACSLYRYSHQKEEYTMAIDRSRKSRDYLYGRLLAVADCLEGFALSEVEKGRPTNAARLMQRFANHPCSTWRTIELALAPYKARLGHKIKKYDDELQQIMCLFDPDEFIKDDTPLSGEFLLGFHSQRAELYKKATKSDANTEEESKEVKL
ncbi:type I-C CRISPR-associated protein Cas8c/Csd1, partial [candidate division KSB3 bacterium]|nr:type I-C CRISPR-associated protein Cas8c/Csd1 [candidate division KSB3 bacterium]